jgi:hypothetical protein|uniref:Uncharacterized protein n=1 Tax=Desulfobacca acetoxidans TaxID=60893 RepID=A0A7V6DR49_9BACT
MQTHQKDQEFLLSAQETLAAETQEMVQVSNRLHDNIVKAVRLMWRQLFLIWALVIVLLVTYFLVLHNISATGHVAASMEKATDKAGASAQILVAPALPPTPQVAQTIRLPEWEEINGILKQIRKAQIEKNISQFLQVYSPTFPNLERKKESILKIWQKYDYLDMSFAIENIQKPDAHTIIAKVAWDITLKDSSSKKKNTVKKDYTVYFSYISGKWLIQNLLPGEKT